MTTTVKERVLEQLRKGWHTSAMLTHYCNCSKKAAEKAIHDLRKERADVRKLSVKGSGYYCIAQEQPEQDDNDPEYDYDPAYDGAYDGWQDDIVYLPTPQQKD